MLAILALAALSTACHRGATPPFSIIPVVTAEPGVPLRSLGTIAVVIPGPNGMLVSVGTSGLGTSTELATAAVDLVRRAGDLMRFELQRIGFVVAPDTAQASGVAEFSVGKVQFDSQRGWLAENAVLVFRRIGMRTPIAGFQTTARIAMPGADSLVLTLAKTVRTRF